MPQQDKPGRGRDDKKAPERNPFNNDSAPRKEPPRMPRAAWVWLTVFCLIGALFFMRNHSSTQIKELSQSQFEQLLAQHRIISAELVEEGNNTVVASGDYQPSEAPAPGQASPPEAAGKYKTRLLMSPRLNTLLENTQFEIKSNNAGVWNFILFGILPVVILVGAIYFMASRQMRMSGRSAADFGRSKARMIPADELHVSFDDIAGADEAKEEIAEIVDYLRDPLRYQLIGGRIPKGCLLVGAPGTGKTLMAKAVACEAGVPFFSISGSDFVEMFVGVGASRVRDMFELARKHMPCLIFIDEIDAVGRSRFSGWGGGHDEREQTLNAMLVEMDGLESRTGVIVLAATNRPDVLDPALLRPGRFDRQVVMDLPDIRGRRQILDVHIKRIKVDEKIDLDVIARTTPGFSGADLANLCNEAALLAARNERPAVLQSDLEEARDKVSYGRERRSRRITDRERRLTAYHEAGHALVSMHNQYSTPVHKVTIIPRGDAYLGATFYMPKEDIYTRSKLEIEAQMSSAMGGRAAEELVFGDITTGAAGDIEAITDLAKRVVCRYGMSNSIGPIKYGIFADHPYMRVDMPHEEPISSETQREIDLEIRRVVGAALESARKCLIEHRDELEKLALALLERETMSIEEIDVLLGRNPAAAETDPEIPPVDIAPTPADIYPEANGDTPDGV